MKRLFHVAAAMTASLVGPAALANTCANVTFSVPTFPQFDPINGNYVAQTITATVSRFNTSAKSVKMILLDSITGTPLKLASAGPIYNITSSGTTVYPAGTDVTLTAIPGTTINIPNASSVIASFSFTIPNTTTDFIGGASFSEPLQYSFQCFTGPNLGGTALAGPDLNISAFTIPVTISKLVTITTAGPAAINFGNFTTTTQQLLIGVKSTSSINVSIATTNVNQMVLSGAVSPFPTNSTIPYSMTYDGVAVASGSNLVNQARAGVGGGTRNLVLTLPGLPSGKLAGSYSDTITLTLTPGA